jgi:g-D-glutamyl-meso-diaminopimelate peptidase
MEHMRELYPGDQGTWVRYLQLALRRAGQAVEIDGVFGEKTCEAVEAFMGSSGSCVIKDTQWNRLLPFLRGYAVHTVEEGDSLYRIAKMHGALESAIRIANPGLEEANLHIGSVIVVPLPFSLVTEEVPYSSQLVEWIVEGLVARYPYLESGMVGRSVMGSPIWYLKLGNGTTEVSYNASFHANESITTPILLKFAEKLLEAYVAEETYRDVYPERLFSEYALYLVPMVNPDGVDLVNGTLDSGRFYRQATRIAQGYPDIPFPDGWKANIDGVDLNLQFPAGWEQAREIKYGQGYTGPAPRDFVGTTPLSAPESIAMYEFTRSHTFALILAYHTQGEVIYWRYLDYEPAGSHEIAKYFESVSGYRVEETPAASGFAGYRDWFILAYDRPGYTIEAGKGTNPLPMKDFPQIYADNVGILLGGMTQL